MHRYLYHTDEAVHERELYVANVVVEDRINPLAPCPVLDNSMNSSRLLCLAFVFSGFLFFLFPAFVAYPSLFNSLLKADVLQVEPDALIPVSSAFLPNLLPTSN